MKTVGEITWNEKISTRYRVLRHFESSSRRRMEDLRRGIRVECAGGMEWELRVAEPHGRVKSVRRWRPGGASRQEP